MVCVAVRPSPLNLSSALCLSSGTIRAEMTAVLNATHLLADLHWYCVNIIPGHKTLVKHTGAEQGRCIPRGALVIPWVHVQGKSLLMATGCWECVAPAIAGLIAVPAVYLWQSYVLVMPGDLANGFSRRL